MNTPKSKKNVWNKGIVGYSIEYPQNRKPKVRLSIEHVENIKKAVPRGAGHSSWKGDKVGYASLHEWVVKTLGRPSYCEHCDTKTAKRFEWANRSHTYKRVNTDWIRLCTSCHRKYDLKHKRAVIK